VVSLENVSVNPARVPMSSQVLEIRGQLFGFSPKVKDILSSIGGTSRLLPLFAQIDRPLIPKD
jgi:hypothetical protein